MGGRPEGRNTRRLRAKFAAIIPVSLIDHLQEGVRVRRPTEHLSSGSHALHRLESTLPLHASSAKVFRFGRALASEGQHLGGPLGIGIAVETG
jgi:hypothetical protein